MPYEAKPGDFSLFKNDKKQPGDNKPDYNGSGIAPDGTECWISAWVKRPEGKKPFFSIRIEPKQPKAMPEPADYVPAPEPAGDLPF